MEKPRPGNGQASSWRASSGHRPILDKAENPASKTRIVVLLGQDCADEAGDGVAVRKDPDDVGAAADFLVQPLVGLLDQIWRQISFGKLVKASTSARAASRCSVTVGSVVLNWSSSLSN